MSLPGSSRPPCQKLRCNAEERMSACSLRTATPGNGWPGEEFRASRSGSDGRVCAAAWVRLLGVTVGKPVTENTGTEVIVWPWGMALSWGIQLGGWTNQVAAHHGLWGAWQHMQDEQNETTFLMTACLEWMGVLIGWDHQKYAVWCLHDWAIWRAHYIQALWGPTWLGARFGATWELRRGARGMCNQTRVWPTHLRRKGEEKPKIGTFLLFWREKKGGGGERRGGKRRNRRQSGGRKSQRGQGDGWGCWGLCLCWCLTRTERQDRGKFCTSSMGRAPLCWQELAAKCILLQDYFTICYIFLKCSLSFVKVE